MTDRRPDPVDDLLAGLDLPPLSADFANRVVAEAQRPDRVPAPAPLPSRRPRRRRWTRRGAWTAVLAINLVLASAVAAALGSGAISTPRLIAAARHVVERLTHGGAAERPHSHPAPALNGAPASPARRPSPPPAIARPPLDAAAPALRPPVGERRLPIARAIPRGGVARPVHPARMHVAPLRQVRPARHRLPGAAVGARRAGATAMPAERRRFGPGPGRRFDGPGLYGPRFDGARARPARFRGGARFDGARFGGGERRRGGGFARAWRGRRGGPRRF